jgi:hypothetical protein
MKFATAASTVSAAQPARPWVWAGAHHDTITLRRRRSKCWPPTVPRRPLSGANLKLASGITPDTGAAAGGVNIGLGTDGREQQSSGHAPGSRVARQGTAAMRPKRASVSKASTARCLGARRHDQLAHCGQAGNMVAVNLSALNSPLYDHYHLIHAAGRSMVCLGGRRPAGRGKRSPVSIPVASSPGQPLTRRVGPD